MQIALQAVLQAPWALVLIIVILLVYVRLRDEFREELKDFRGWMAAVNANLIVVMALLASEGRISWGEFLSSVRGLLGGLEPRSRYYTEADWKELKRILDKDYTEYTEEDAKRIEEIAEKVRAEARATGRGDLYEAYYHLRNYALLIRLYLRLGKKTT